MDGYGRGRGGGGQALPLVAALMWLIAGVTLVVLAVGERAVERARAQAGADAVALAIAGDGDASDMARRNGVALEVISEGDSPDVVVSIGPVRAATRAQRDRPEWRGLDPRLRDALRGGAEAILGRPIAVVSGWRTTAAQERLWAARRANPYPVAPPGTSLHERGLAVDVSLGDAPALARLWRQTGLCRPLPQTDPVHFVLC